MARFTLHILSQRTTLLLAVLCLMTLRDCAWAQANFDLINDLELLVPADAKALDEMLDVEIRGADQRTLSRVESAFSAARSSRETLKVCESYFEDTHKNELRFLHSVVNLKRSQFVAIDAELQFASRQAYLELTQNLLNHQNQQGAGWPRHFPEHQSVGQATFRFQDDLLKLASEKLEPDDADRYRDEILARRDFAKEAMIESMTASLAIKFVFSKSQHEQVKQLIRENWRDSWRDNTSTLLYHGVGGVRNFPRRQFFDLLRSNQKVYFESIRWEPKETQEISKLHSVRVSALRATGAGKPIELIDELTFVPEEVE